MQVWTNCYSFNEPGSYVCVACDEMAALFSQSWKQCGLEKWVRHQLSKGLPDPNATAAHAHSRSESHVHLTCGCALCQVKAPERDTHKRLPSTVQHSVDTSSKVGRLFPSSLTARRAPSLAMICTAAEFDKHPHLQGKKQSSGALLRHDSSQGATSKGPARPDREAPIKSSGDVSSRVFDVTFTHVLPPDL